jgi:hypothetical protein
MCLNVKIDSVVKTAKRDIVVYKRLKTDSYKTIEEVKDGDLFTGKIYNRECSGKIHKTAIGEIYFCTNDDLLIGKVSPEKFEYEYSWILTNSCTSVVVNGVELIGKVINVEFLETPFKNFKVIIGETYTSELIKDEAGNVHEGLHSFRSYKNLSNSGIIAKCIIPKGSQYYEGKFGKKISYASNKLTYVEIVK